MGFFACVGVGFFFFSKVFREKKKKKGGGRDAIVSSLSL